jgi:hypothetical protein
MPCSLAAACASDVSKYYKAARIYNSGGVDPSGSFTATLLHIQSFD